MKYTHKSPKCDVVLKCKMKYLGEVLIWDEILICWDWEITMNNPFEVKGFRI